jgi:hypothetical protein
MRNLALGLSALTIVTLAALSAPASAVDPARSAGAYSVVAARDVDACARACANDGLCMVWSFRAGNSCELMATVPASPPAGVYGVSPRAPASIRQLTPVETPQTAKAADTPRALPATDVAETPPHVEPEAPLPEEDTLALLGGPENETLRPRLGARQ